MVVPSSNNKAVVNVSAELPAMDAIAEDADALRYFKSVADNVLERDSWGIISAVLGNASNRFLFSQGFWRDEESGLSTYLNHACGLPQVVSEPQEDGPPRKRNRQIVDGENPPANQQEALKRWVLARADYNEKLKVSKSQQAKLQKTHQDIVRAQEMRIELDRLASAIMALEGERPAREAQLAEHPSCSVPRPCRTWPDSRTSYGRAIGAWGKVQIAAIAATGLAQAGSPGGSNAASGGGSGASGVSATSGAGVSDGPRCVLLDFNGSPSWVEDMFEDITKRIQEGSDTGVIYEVSR